MDGLSNTFRLFGIGIKDCMLGVLAVRKFWSRVPDTNPIRKRHSSETPKTLSEVLKQCLVFGILFWIALFGFNRGVLNHGITFLESYLEQEERDSITWFPNFLWFLFCTFWTLPLFLASRIMNYSWYQQIADMTFENSGGKKRNVASVSYEWGDQIESTVVQCLFMAQGYAMLMLPLPKVVQHVLLNLHLSLLYALYSFEYKWVQLGWGLRKRLSYINTKWPYFVGFGLPLAIVSSYVGTYIESLCIFSTLFPIYVVSSTVSIDNRVQHYRLPIKFFGPASYITNFFFVYLLSRMHTRR